VRRVYYLSFAVRFIKIGQELAEIYAKQVSSEGNCTSRFRKKKSHTKNFSKIVDDQA
jgi:hypothetical protein